MAIIFVMKKILIIGSSGAGKSTFARRLSTKTNIDVVHLDKLYWKPNWVGTTDANEWKEKIDNVLVGDSWIIDGNYSGTLERRLQSCDTVFFLDMPRLICMWRILKRFVLNRGKSRPDITEGCNEQLTWEFIKWTWNYPTRSKPKVEKLLEQYQTSKTIVKLRSNEAVEGFLKTL